MLFVALYSILAVVFEKQLREKKKYFRVNSSIAVKRLIMEYDFTVCLSNGGNVLCKHSCQSKLLHIHIVMSLLFTYLKVFFSI